MRSFLFLVLFLAPFFAGAENVQETSVSDGSDAEATPLNAPVDLRPKWEVGVALGSQYLADYRGSSEYGAKVLPVPFFVYRGDRLRVDRKGLRGDLLRSKAWEFNVSGEVSLSGGRDGNAKREGMPELDSAFEIGPSLNIALDGNIIDDGWLLRLPARAVFSAGSSGVGYVGYLINPKISYIKDTGTNGWRFSGNVGATYASQDYHAYYYQVDTEFVLEDRPYYAAREGYSGTYFKSSLSRRLGSWRYGVSVRYDNISGTHFAENSPLVETDHYFSVSFLLAKFLWASE